MGQRGPDGLGPTHVLAGSYRVEGLPSGTYSVTVTAEGLRQQTAMVVVMEGLTSFQDLALASGGG